MIVRKRFTSEDVRALEAAVRRHPSTVSKELNNVIPIGRSASR